MATRAKTRNVKDIEILAGRRGTKNDSAIRWKDLDRLADRLANGTFAAALGESADGVVGASSAANIKDLASVLLSGDVGDNIAALRATTDAQYDAANTAIYNARTYAETLTAAVSGEVTALEQSISADLEEAFNSAQAELDLVKTDISGRISDDIDAAELAITQVLTQYGETMQALAWAGITIDQEAGTATIGALSNAEGKIANAELEIDGVKALITQRVTYAEMNEAITAAQLPALDDIFARITAVELDLNAQQGQITAKAETTTVDGLSLTVTEQGQEIDNLTQSLTQYARTTEVNALSQTLNEVTQALDTSGGTAALNTSVTAARQWMDELDSADFSSIGDMLDGYRGREAQATDLAEFRGSILSTVSEEREARAIRFEELTASVDENASRITSQEQAFANEQEATATRFTEMASKISGVSDDVEAVSANILENYLTSADTQEAIAALQTTLEARFDAVDETIATVSATLDQNYYTKAEADNALAAMETSLTSTITGSINSTLSQNYYTKSTLDASFTGIVSQMNAQYGATSASLETQATAIATLEGWATSTYVLRAKAGDAESSLELVAADDPVNGPASVLRLSADDILLDGTIHAGLMAVDSVLASHIVIDDLLVMAADTAAFAMGKTDAYDAETDGAFFGRTPSAASESGLGFSFAISRTAPSGLREELNANDRDGLTAKNMRFFRSLYQAAGSISVASSQTVTLDKTTTKYVSAMCIGGGGGGSDAESPPRGGYAGGSTTVYLRDGATVVATLIGAGGAAAPAGGWSGSTTDGEAGHSSPFGTGGAGGVRDASGNSRSKNAGGNATGYGAGGGGAGTYGLYRSGAGGRAGTVAHGPIWDISSLTSPNILVSIGAGGLGRGARESMDGGNGSPGYARIYLQASADIQANVIPLAPSAEGTMNAAGPYPDLGAGLWEVFTSDGSPVYLGWVGGAGASTIRLHEPSYVSFVSSQTPWHSSGGHTKTVYYKFFYMGHD